MFGFFDDPFFTPRRRQRSFFDDPFSFGYQSPMERYLNRLENSYNQMLQQAYEEELAEYQRIKEERAKHLAQTQAQKQQQEPPKEPAAKPEDKKEEPKQPVAHQQQRNLPYQGFFYSSRKSYDGQNYVEEHRETVTDQNGKQYNSVTRRLGDRWYQNEEHIDEEGKKTSKETWHNVPEAEMDAFKKEWSESQGKKQLGSSEQPQQQAVTNEAKPAEEPKKEEAKKE